jgi:hypothetical protein
LNTENFRTYPNPPEFLEQIPHIIHHQRHHPRHPSVIAAIMAISLGRTPRFVLNLRRACSSPMAADQQADNQDQRG